MKVKQLAANMTELEHKGWTILFSYETPVAAINSGELFVTDKKWSVTTSRHIGKWRAGKLYGELDAIKSQQIFFDNLVENL